MKEIIKIKNQCSFAYLKFVICHSRAVHEGYGAVNKWHFCLVAELFGMTDHRT